MTPISPVPAIRTISGLLRTAVEIDWVMVPAPPANNPTAVDPVKRAPREMLPELKPFEALVERNIPEAMTGAEIVMPPDVEPEETLPPSAVSETLLHVPVDEDSVRVLLDTYLIFRLLPPAVDTESAKPPLVPFSRATACPPSTPRSPDPALRETVGLLIEAVEID